MDYDSSGHVIQLYLANNQLSGSIPPELGNLSRLTNLHLYFNQLSGSIPPELVNLSHLTILDLHSNQLSGPIPAALVNLYSLDALSLYNNPNLVCWQTQAALDWAQGLDEYFGPTVVCPFVALPVLLSNGG